LDLWRCNDSVAMSRCHIALQLSVEFCELGLLHSMGMSA
jgi:hypothetical protein